jgi:hypothetical protein
VAFCTEHTGCIPFSFLLALFAALHAPLPADFAGLRSFLCTDID